MNLFRSLLHRFRRRAPESDRLEQERRKSEQLSEQLRTAMNNERIINQCLQRITLETDFDSVVQEMLGIIGSYTGSDRCYIFRCDGSRADNVYEWTGDGIEPQKNNLQGLDISSFPCMRNCMETRQDLIVSDLAAMRAEDPVSADFLAQQSIQSLLISIIWQEDRIWGFVGIDFVRRKHEFTSTDLHMVRSIVNLFWLAHERMQQINRIADSVALQRQIVDNVSIPLVMFNEDYGIIMANPATCELVGHPESELIGRKCFETLCGLPEPPEWCPLAQVKEDRQAHRILFSGHGNHHYQVTVQPIFDRRQRLMAVLESAIDITDMVKQKEQIETAMAAAQAANRAKSYFLATMSHELRTPLNAVLGFSELLQNDGLSRGEQIDYLKSLNYAGTALLNLINDVLDLSKLEADRLSLSLTRVDVTALLAEVAAIFRVKAEEKKLRLSCRCDGVPKSVYLDTIRMRQILLNLVGNAVKFTARGGVDLEAEFLAAETGGVGTLRILVCDSGIGIAPEFIDKLFDPFTQEDSTRGNRVYEGSGLGLAISIRLAQCMGGTIRVDSRPGRGSTFAVVLEQVRFDAEAAPQAEEDNTLSPGEWRRGRILLVDDVPMNLKVLQAMLRRLAIDSLCADSGQAALEMLARDRNFSLILSDLWMPQMSGVELAGRIRDDPRTAHIPVCAVTADVQVNEESSGHFQDILLKPITLDGLKRFLAKYQSGPG